MVPIAGATGKEGSLVADKPMRPIVPSTNRRPSCARSSVCRLGVPETRRPPCCSPMDATASREADLGPWPCTIQGEMFRHPPDTLGGLGRAASPSIAASMSSRSGRWDLGRPRALRGLMGSVRCLGGAHPRSPAVLALCRRGSRPREPDRCRGPSSETAARRTSIRVGHEGGPARLARTAGIRPSREGNEPYRFRGSFRRSPKAGRARLPTRSSTAIAPISSSGCSAPLRPMPPAGARGLWVKYSKDKGRPQQHWLTHQLK